MLERINELLGKGESFAFETTLSTRSYANLVERAHANGYEVTLLFLALDSTELAINRVATRVREGGHNIPTDTVIRRFHNGLSNFFKIYMPIVDKWLLVNNSLAEFEFIAKGIESEVTIINERKWSQLNKKYHGK